MFGIEKWLFEVFPKMPAWVRIITYLVILALFVYLILVPRFIDGQLVVKNPMTGGLLPYRGADLQIQVEGRDYKFRSNEGGFFSVPIISRLPESVAIQIYLVDMDEWQPLEIPVTKIWSVRAHQIEILAEKPFVRLTSPSADAATTVMVVRALEQIVPLVHAQVLKLPATPSVQAAQLSTSEKNHIRSQVAQSYAKVTGRRVEETTPGSRIAGGDQGLTYVQRIQLVTELERDLKLKIPDDHWQQMTTLDQLVDYLEKRKQLERAQPAPGPTRERTWSEIQQSFPVDERPIYRR